VKISFRSNSMHLVRVVLLQNECVSKIFSPTWPNAPKNKPQITDVENNAEKEARRETWREIVDATSSFYLVTCW
jgi:hypothetical protein